MMDLIVTRTVEETSETSRKVRLLLSGRKCDKWEKGYATKNTKDIIEEVIEEVTREVEENRQTEEIIIQEAEEWEDPKRRS